MPPPPVPLTATVAHQTAGERKGAIMGCKPGHIAYIHNGDSAKRIEDYVTSHGGYLRPDYCFIEDDGERKELKYILNMAVPGDSLYVFSVKAFYMGSLEEFKETLKTIEKKEMTVYSMAEPEYDCDTFLAAIDIVQRDILRDYMDEAEEHKAELEEEIETLKEQKKSLAQRGGRPKKEIEAIEALALYRTGRFRIEEICEFTGLSKSSLFRALADAEEDEEEEDQE